MIRLVYSNRTEELLAALAETLRERRAAGAHPLAPVHLLVPNRNLEQLVRQGLAERLGVAANLRFRRLERFVAELVREADPQARLIDADALRGGLLGLFHAAGALDEPPLAPVRDYLAAPDEDARALRRVQLATRLSRLFEEYAYSRPEMLAAWLQRQTLADGHLAELERWQRALWLALAGGNGWLARHPPAVAGGEGRWVELAAISRGQLALPGSEPLHVFGVSYVASAFQHLFQRLALGREVCLFTLNPCQEFWEDVETPREHRRRLRARRVVPQQPEDPFGLFTDTDNRPLQWWGRPGREHVSLLSEMTECDFEARFVDQPGPTLLHAFQGDILRRAATDDRPPHEPWARDGSVTFLAAPDPRREVEAVADALWGLMARSEVDPEPLRWSDVAVIVNAAARDTYLPQVQAVFAEYHAIPCSVGDLPFGGERRLGEAAQLLLELPFGRLSRADLLSVMLHPAVRGRLPDVEPEEWSRLAEELGIFHGASHADLADTYVEEDLLSWDQGLRRLALGSFLTGARSGDDRLWRSGEREVRVADVPASRLEGAAQFALLARSLLADCRRLREERRSLRQWAAALRRMLAAYLAPGEGEEADLARCLGAMATLERSDVGGVAVSGRVACELARESLAGLSTRGGGGAGSGVVVSTLLPMRAIPFRVVFVLGLAEGAFPAANRRDALDLRAAGRLAGDVTPAERDRYLFLEALLSARDRLVLSYVARDERTGKELRPSSVVLELQEVLERSYVGKEGLSALTVQVPARRWTPEESVTTVAPGAAAEVAARRLGDDLRRAVADLPADPLPMLRRKLPAAEWAALARFLAVPRIEPVPTHEPRGDALTATAPPLVGLGMKRLRELLECPLQASAKTLLGLDREEDEDRAAVEDEPLLRSGPGTATMLVREALARALRRDEDVRAAYAALRGPKTLAGELPQGVLGELERELHVERLVTWQEVLARLELHGGERIRLGRAPEREEFDALLPAIRLADRAGVPRWELHGRSELLVAGRSVSVLADLFGTGDERTELKVRELRLTLRGLFDHLLLAAGGALAGVPRTLVLLRSQKGELRCVERRLHPLAQRDALAYLTTLGEDLYEGVHDYLLPCEAVFTVYDDAADQSAPLDSAAIAREAIRRITNPRVDCQSRYGPVPDVASYAPPPPERITEIVERRFRPFFKLLGPETVLLGGGPVAAEEPVAS